MRVTKRAKPNRADIDFIGQECVVRYKSNNYRVAYFEARTPNKPGVYLGGNDDDYSALFVDLHAPHRGLSIGAIMARLRQLVEALNIQKIHPHKFRRTLATKTMDKGKPVIQL